MLQVERVVNHAEEVVVLIGRGARPGGRVTWVCSLCDESLSFTADSMYVACYTLIKTLFFCN